MTPFTKPIWAAAFPAGWHLDVVRGRNIVEKILLEGLVVAMFGRNEDVCQIVLSHPSASRLHAALCYQPEAERAFLCDLGSTHGSFHNSERLQPNQLVALAEGSSIRFGGSTRSYVLRTQLPDEEDISGRTIYNAAVAAVPVTQTGSVKRAHPTSAISDEVDIDVPIKKMAKCVRFSEDVTVHPGEMIDKGGGRFAELVTTTTVLPSRVTAHKVKPAVKSKKIRSQPMTVAPLGGLFAPAFLPRATRQRKVTPPPPRSANSTEEAHQQVTVPLALGPEGGERQIYDGTGRRKKYAKESWPRAPASAIYSDDEG